MQIGGCERIAGELKKLGHTLSDTTIENVMKASGIDPQPTRTQGTAWQEFLAAHWECVAAIDFTTVEVWTPAGLKTIYLLFVMELSTRRVQYLGSSAHPTQAWMLDAIEKAVADNGILGGDDHPTILIMDHDSKFSAAVKDRLRIAGIKAKLTAIRAPNMNAHLERFIGSYKRELVHRMIFFGKRMLDHVTSVYLQHFHGDRPHQDLGNELIVPLKGSSDRLGPVAVTRQLGGLLKHTGAMRHSPLDELDIAGRLLPVL